LRLRVEKERLPRSSLRLERPGEEPGDCRGVEPEASESDSKEAARLCILRLWLSLLFIRDNRVTLFVREKEFILYKRGAGGRGQLEIVGLCT